MSLEINQIALHQLIKRDEQTLEVVLRDSLLEPTATVVEMMAELHRVYSVGSSNESRSTTSRVCSSRLISWCKAIWLISRLMINSPFRPGGIQR